MKVKKDVSGEWFVGYGINSYDLFNNYESCRIGFVCLCGLFNR